MNNFITPLLIIAIFVLWYGNWLFTRLLRREYQSHRDDWEHDGRPGWSYHYVDGLKSFLASQRVWVTWLLRNPPWAERDSAAPFMRWRIFTVIGLALFAVVIVGLLAR